MSAACNAYVRGRIGIEELETRLERELLREVGRNHPVPPGWTPLPPCAHLAVIEITQLGSRARVLTCQSCADTWEEDF